MNVFFKIPFVGRLVFASINDSVIPNLGLHFFASTVAERMNAAFLSTPIF